MLEDHKIPKFYKSCSGILQNVSNLADFSTVHLYTPCRTLIGGGGYSYIRDLPD